MMRSQGDHYQVSEDVLSHLPEWQQNEWNEVRTDFLTKYSSYVDNLSPVVAPKQCAAIEPDYRDLLYIDGIFCQCLLGDHTRRFAPLVRYSGDPGGDHIIGRDPFFRVFGHYLDRLIEALVQRDHVKAAKLGGIVSHLICDRNPGDHIDPGIWTGLLFPPPPGVEVSRSDCWTITTQEVDIPKVIYEPQLLGVTAEEAIYRSYQGYLRMMKRGIPYVGRMLDAVYRGCPEEAQRLLSEARLLGIEVISDYLYTAFCIAYDRFDQRKVEALSRVDLTTWFAAVNEMDNLYYYGPYTDSSVDFFADGKLLPRRVPPSLFVQDKPQEAPMIRELQPVLAVLPDSGAQLPERWAKLVYELPPGCYRRFRCLAGLHARLSVRTATQDRGRVAVRVLGDETILFEIELMEGGEPAVPIDIDITGYRRLTLLVSGLHRKAEEFWAGHFVWARPELEKHKS